MSNPTGTALTTSIGRVITDEELFAFIRVTEYTDPDDWRRGHLASVWAGRSATGQDFELLKCTHTNPLEDYAADVVAYQNQHPNKIVFAKFRTFTKQLKPGMTAKEYIDAYWDDLRGEQHNTTFELPENPFRKVRIAPATMEAILMIKSQI